MNGYTTIDNTPAAPAIFELEEKKSHFIGHAARVESEEEAQTFLEAIRAQHREARHNVFAYVLREGSRERQSDDGEPQKTSGLPTLEVIRHSGLVDVMVVTTRYFGGTLLGTGGLVRAYTQAAQGVLAAARQVLVSSCVDIMVELPYSAYDQALFRIGQHPARILDTSFTDTVALQLRMIEGTQAPLLAELTELLRGADGILVGDPQHAVF